MSNAVNRRNFLRASACGAAAGVLGLSGHAQQSAAPPVAPAPTKSSSGAEFINQEAQTEIARCLELLAPGQQRLLSARRVGHRCAAARRGWSVALAAPP